MVPRLVFAEKVIKIFSVYTLNIQRMMFVLGA